MVTCVFEDGGKGKLRHVTVKALTVNSKNQFLLEKRGPTLSRPGKYDIPGGYMDLDETTEQTALRELAEETGIQGKIKFLFRINDNPKRPNEDRQNVDFIYVVEAIGEEIKIDHESSEAGWYSEDELPENSEFAFDHLDSINKYLAYLKEPFQLPIIG